MSRPVIKIEDTKLKDSGEPRIAVTSPYLAEFVTPRASSAASGARPLGDGTEVQS